MSKIYDRYIHDEINAYFDGILSKFQCGFHRGYIAQHRLLYMIEKIRKIKDSKRVFAAVLTDLSKAFDCILHELLLAKLHAYDSDKISLTFMHAYLSQRLQKTKVGSTFSELMSILFGVPQGSILGPFLYIIYVCDLFILNDHLEFESYVDDTIPSVYGENLDEILGELEKHMTKISEWFLHNCLKANVKKCHLSLSPFVDKAINIENFTIKSSYAEVLLEITIDRNIKVDSRVG